MKITRLYCKVPLILLLLILRVPDRSEQQQSISWTKRVDQQDTSCRSKTIIETDIIILHSRISMGSFNDFTDRAQYEIKKLGSNYETLCYVDLAKCKGYTISNCYCNKKREPYVIDVTINMTAQTSVSEATIKGTIYNYNNQIYSDEVRLPTVTAASNIDIKVYINDKLIMREKCEEMIQGRTAVIVFIAPDNLKQQVLLSVQNSKTGKLIRKESNILMYTELLNGPSHFEFSYEISSVPSRRKSFSCTIYSTSACEDLELQCKVFAGLFVCSLLADMSVVVVIMFIKIKFNVQCKDKELLESLDGFKLQQQATITLGSKQGDFNLDKAKYIRFLETVSILPTDMIELTNIDDEANKNALERIFSHIFSEIQQEKKFPKIRLQLENMVTMKVNRISNRRPRHWPGETIPYPYYSSRGCDTDRLGVGRIVSVKLMNKDNKETSLVWRSQYPKFNKTEWIEIIVYTSRHVVFDDVEAKHTICSLLINDSIHGNLSFKGEIVNMANINENWILFTCVSHAVTFFDILKTSLLNFDAKWSKVLKTPNKCEKIITLGYMVTLPQSEIKRFKMSDLINVYFKDLNKKRLWKTLNTYFHDQKQAIYLERNNDYFMYRFQTNRTLTEGKYVMKDLKLSSFLLILKFPDDKILLTSK